MTRRLRTDGTESEMGMDQHTVRTPDGDIERAMAEVIRRRSEGGDMPLLPLQRTMDLMAKAAVAVYEAVAEAGDTSGGSR